MSRNFFVLFVMKSENFFVFMSWSDRFTCFDGRFDPGLTNACTIILLSFKVPVVESSKNENPIASSERSQTCGFSFFIAASDTCSPDEHNSLAQRCPTFFNHLSDLLFQNLCGPKFTIVFLLKTKKIKKKVFSPPIPLDLVMFSKEPINI